jgi:anti-anti-sigma regulatory factor
MMNRAEPSEPMIGAKYRSLSRIASGGMAELFLGEAVSAGGVSRKVALKRILPRHAEFEEYLQMFLEEARVASMLQHPNIVQTYDVVRDGDDYVIVMELLEGADLFQLRRRMHATRRAMTLSQVLYVTRSLLSGLHYAHERLNSDGTLLEIVHRDVSPQNIFLTFDGTVKLLDFGIAKAMAAPGGPTDSGVLKGKVRYMSPEQCTGQPLDRRADVYSVGVVLYQLLTGVAPHRGATPVQTMQRILEDEVVPLHEHDPRIDQVLNDIVLRALAKRRDDRFPTALDMQVELERYVEANGLFISAHSMTEFVEAVLGPRAEWVPGRHQERGGRGDGPSARGPEGTQRASASGESARLSVQVLFECSTLQVKRIGGALVLALSGVIDEGFDRAAFVSLLRGEVIVDSSEVTRITSYGIRQLLQLFSEASGQITGLYHVGCSVPWMLQVAMIRNLLGGGRVLSFHAPYVDAGDGRSFAHLLRGEEAVDAVQHHRLPVVPSPSDPTLPATFDDEPAVYFAFEQDFLSEPPRHLVPVLRFHESQRRQPLDLELVVNASGSTLFVRAPLRDDRWRRAVLGLEGAVRIDLTDAPPPDEGDIADFLGTLDGMSDDLMELHLVGAPVRMVRALVGYPQLCSITQVESVAFGARCRACGAERRLCIPYTNAPSARAPAIDPCAKCGELLVPTDELIGSLPGVSGRTPSAVPRREFYPTLTPVSVETRARDGELAGAVGDTGVSSRSADTDPAAHFAMPIEVGYLVATSFALATVALSVVAWMLMAYGAS